jgi:hypothetical protein
MWSWSFGCTTKPFRKNAEIFFLVNSTIYLSAVPIDTYIPMHGHMDTSWPRLSILLDNHGRDVRLEPSPVINVRWNTKRKVFTPVMALFRCRYYYPNDTPADSAKQRPTYIYLMYYNRTINNCRRWE